MSISEVTTVVVASEVPTVEVLVNPPITVDVTLETITTIAVESPTIPVIDIGVCEQGPPGPKGDKGDKGDTGATGPAGTTDYNNLLNTPTNLSQFSNDLGFISAEVDTLDSVTSRGNTTTNDITVGNIYPSGVSNTKDLGTPTQRWAHIYVGPGSVDIDGVVLSNSGATLNINHPIKFTTTNLTFDGSFNQLIDKPIISSAGASGSYTDLSDKPNLSSVALSGSYTDLTDKPTNVSYWTNDAGYITAAQALGNLSVSTNPVGTNALTYSNGVFTFTPTDLSSYVTNTSLTTTLANYETISALNTTLANYVTNTSLTTTLASYATQSYVLGKNYITTANLSVNTNPAGANALTYSNGVFTFTPTDLSSYATTSYVNTQITNLINGAPTILDTLGEIAAALQGDETTIGGILTTLSTKITLTNLSVVAGAATGGGELSYNNTNGQFTFSPAAATTINGTAVSPGGSINVGTVTSVSGTGTVSGLTLTGSVTSSGSLTLGGTLSGIGNSQLTNSTISGVSLGSNLFALTAGTGISYNTGTTYNGSAAITINNAGVTSIVAGSNISISGSTGAVTVNNTYSYTLPTASTTVLGGVKVDGTSITINGSGVISTNSSISSPTLNFVTTNGNTTTNSISVGAITLTNGTNQLTFSQDGTIQTTAYPSYLNRTDSKVYYVSSSIGNDTYDGLRPTTAFATVKKALTSRAASGLDRTIIFIQPGVYSEIFPLTVPPNTVVKGAGLKAVTIQPTTGTKSNDCFYMDDNTAVSDLTISGQLYNAVGDTGYAFKFNPAGITITSRSPYVERLTVIQKGSVTSSSDPYGFAQGDAGRGVLLDGQYVNHSSIEPAMLFNECTFFTPNSRTLIMTNGARCEWLNCFSYFSDLHIEGYFGTVGYGGAGKTYVTLTGKTGTWSAGNTLSLYANDHTTLIASATIASVSGNTLTLSGSISGFVTNTTRASNYITPAGNAQNSITQSKFGGASLSLDGTGDWLQIATNPDFGWGTADFTVECWVYVPNLTKVQTLFDFRTANNDTALWVNVGNTGSVNLTVNNGSRINSGTQLPTNTWTHVAIGRYSGVTRMWIGGVLQGQTYNDANNYASRPLVIGADWTGGTNFQGYIDEVRFTKGLARYTNASFTPQTQEWTGDSNTVLLLHFNGANGSPSFIDDGVSLQDVRSSGGGTATGITRYDRSEFGAELRANAGAVVYGNRGIKATGAISTSQQDVVLQLMSFNIAFIGTGADLTNDKSAIIVANQIIELTGGKVIYVTIDQSGLFSVGSLFQVDFATGAVTVGGGAGSLSALKIFTNSIPSGGGSLTFDGFTTLTYTPTAATTINGTAVSPGGSISVGTVTSVSGTGTVNGITLSGTVTSTGSLTLGGTLSGIGNSQLTNSTISGVSLGSNLNALTISSPLSGTSYNGSAAVTLALASGYGDTQNPYASKTANFFLAAPNGLAGVPTFRAIVAADIPTLNQNTTGSAGSVTNALTISSPLSGTSYNGGSAVTIALSAGYGDTQNPYASKTANFVLAAPNGLAGVPTFRALVSADIPALSYVTSVSGTGTVSGITLSGTVTSSGSLTLGGSLSLVSPPAIGSTTPNTGAFTTLSASSTVSGTGFSTYLASPPAIGGTTAAAITGTTITANTQFSGPHNGTVGATTPNTGAFTTLSASGNATFSSTITAGGSVGTNGQVLTSTGTGVQWSTAGTGSGSVTSVSGTGTVSGITLSGTVTSTGSLTLGGALDLTSPPAIGSTAANTGAFTTLTASSTVTLSPANANVAISPTGTGTVTISPVGALTINPTAASTINNASIGATTPLAGTFTVLTANGSTNNASIVMSSTALSSTAWTTTGIGIRIPARTYTDTSSAAGTVAASYIHSIAAQTFASTNAITITEAASLFVAAPVAGTNSILTGNGFSIVAGGRVKASDFTGTIGATTASAGTFTQVTVNGANVNTAISPTGTGTVTISPAGTLTLGTAAASTTMLGNISATGSGQTFNFAPTGTGGTFTVNPTAANVTINTTTSGTISITGAAGLTLGTSGQTTTMAGNISATTSNQTVTLSPTGTGTVTINPAGTITVGSSTGGQTLAMANGTTAAGSANTTNIGVNAAAAGTNTITATAAGTGVTITSATYAQWTPITTGALTNSATTGNLIQPNTTYYVAAAITASTTVTLAAYVGGPAITWVASTVSTGTVTVGAINTVSIGPTTAGSYSNVTVQGVVQSTLGLLPRIQTTASAATITPTAATADVYTVTALAVTATFAPPSGQHHDGQKLMIRIKDNGTAQTISWTTATQTSGAAPYRAVGVTLPTTTKVSSVLYVGCIYNAQDNFWDVIAISQL